MPTDDDPVDGRVRRGLDAREARRAQIKETALEVFAERGYHQTSVSDLVAAAGVARGTFYLYFDSKDAIFLELLDDLLAHLRSNIVGVDRSEGAPPVDRQLHDTVVRILDTAVSNRPLTRIIFREAVGLDAAVDARLRAFDEDVHRFVVAALEIGKAIGLVRAIDTDVVATCIIGSLRGLVNRYVVAQDAAFDVEAVTTAVLDFNLHGVLKA